MDSKTSYKSAEIRTFFSDIGYKIEHTSPRDKHAGGIAERTVGLLTGKTNTAMMEKMAPKSMWCWAMFKASQDLNFNYNEKIKTSPYHFCQCKIRLPTQVYMFSIRRSRLLNTLVCIVYVCM